MTTKINVFDRMEDRDRMARGLEPINHTRAEYAADARGELPPKNPVGPPNPPHSYRLSQSAHQVLLRARESIAEMRPLCAAPSASVAVEFLVWWFEQTLKLDDTPSPREFDPATRVGRPLSREYQRPLTPARAREGLGLVPVVQSRKLR
jgi:hypothetical protein